jgi:hypothetical protein
MVCSAGRAIPEDEIGDRGRRHLVHPGNDVGVDSQRDRHRGVAQPLADDLHGHTRLECGRGIAIAQTIQRDLRQPGGGDVLLEPGGEAGRVDSSAVRPGEQQARVDVAAADKRPLGGLDDQVVVERSDGRRVERERAAPGAVFGSETTTWWSTSTRGSLALTRAASRSRSTVRRPATSLRLRQRIDQAKADVDLAAKDARQDASAAAGSARSKWAQMKTDAAAKTDDLQDKMDKRAAAGGAGCHRRPRLRRRPRQVRRRLVLSWGRRVFIQHPAKEAATMVGTVVFPTLSGLRRASSRQQVAGPVRCCSLMSTVWCPGRWPGPSGWQGPGPGAGRGPAGRGRVPVLRNPANCNRAVP